MSTESPDDVVLSHPSPTWGWGSFSHPHPGVHEQHLLPMLDVGMHSFDLQCQCGPVMDVPGSIIHFAFDGREAYEQGGRKRH